MSKGHSPSPPTSFMPSMPSVPSAESLLKAQPRLIILLGLIPTAAAFTYGFLMQDPRGYLVAGLLLGAAAAFFVLQAIVHKMTAVHWGILAGVAFAAVTINAGAPMRAAVLTFVSLLAAITLALKFLKDTRSRVVAALIALCLWLGTANAPWMEERHAGAEAGMAEVGVQLQDIAHQTMERLQHGGR